jgi:signal transduction histidine kinase
MESSEKLRETLIALQRENERLRTETEHAGLLLSALESLLRIDLDNDPFACVFESLRTVFQFEQVMVLAERSNGRLLCIAAEPQALTGLRWPAARLFHKVMGGKVAATFSNVGIDEWRDIPPEMLTADRPALYLPILVREERGILLLLGGRGDGFDRGHVALAKKFSLLASHALAARQDRQQIRNNKARAVAAEDASKAKSLFIANMSHELRTPLNAIIGFSEFMASEILGPMPIRQYTEYTKDILSSGRHLLAIVNDLLLFAKIEAGQHVTALEPIRLAEELAYARRMFEIEAGNRQVRLVQGPVPEELEVVADGQSLRQILINIISNALKFSPPGGIVSIALDPGHTPGTHELRVIDQGCGIPPATLAQLGNPFVQAEGVLARRHEGSGLGVAICIGLAEAMGAAITIDSTVDVGTTVTLRLADAATPAAPAALERALSPA